MHHHGISSAHSDEDIDRIVDGIEAALREIMAWGRGEMFKRGVLRESSDISFMR